MSKSDDGEQFSLASLKKELEQALQKPKKSGIPLYIAALAALLSLISLADKETDKIAMSAHIEASNKFAYFQAKSIRLTESKIASKLFKKFDDQKLATYWQKKAARYNEEKFEIFKTAREQEKIRAKALAKGDYYKVGVTLLQIAIVLASASLVLGGGMLFAMSAIMTIISILYTINGYGMFFEFPTNPGVIMDAITQLLQQVKNGPATR